MPQTSRVQKWSGNRRNKVEKGGAYKKGQLENKPSLEGEGESLPLKLLPCRIFGDARESWPSLWTVSSHPSHPPQPPHPPRALVQVVCSACMCASARHVIIPPHPPHPPRAWIQVMCSASMCASARYVIIPPTPPTPCMGTSDPNEAKWSQFLVASDREVWSQVTACTVEVLLALSANVTFCGRKWPHFVVTSDPNPVFLCVVASDRILWSQVTAMPPWMYHIHMQDYVSISR